MKIILTGSRGLVGSALTSLLNQAGHQIIPLHFSESPSSQNTHWDYEKKVINLELLEDSDAIIHLAGENITEHRWTSAVKDRILKSRVEGTKFLANSLASLKNPPKTFITASAIGYYGDCGDAILSEEAPCGKTFLSKVCKEWEQATLPALEKGIRVINLRFGMILSSQGGALQKILTPFKMGVGGVLGDGKQYISWISIDDAVGSILHALNEPTLQGPVNIVSPQPLTNREFTEILGKVLSRPTSISVPAFALRLMVGEIADELLLCSTRVFPHKLQAAGYQFLQPTLEECLRHILSQDSLG